MVSYDRNLRVAGCSLVCSFFIPLKGTFTGINYYIFLKEVGCL